MYWFKITIFDLHEIMDPNNIAITLNFVNQIAFGTHIMYHSPFIVNVLVMTEQYLSHDNFLHTVLQKHYIKRNIELLNGEAYFFLESYSIENVLEAYFYTQPLHICLGVISLIPP